MHKSKTVMVIVATMTIIMIILMLTIIIITILITEMQRTSPQTPCLAPQSPKAVRNPQRHRRL